jgi:hypothetical protein
MHAETVTSTTNVPSDFILQLRGPATAEQKMFTPPDACVAL